MSGTFSVKNFDRFQHYKDRSPPWIKLYGELLEDYEFGTLPDVAKAHLLSIWLLASRMGNKLPLNPDWIGSKINSTEPVDLVLLIDAGFLVPYEAGSAKGKLEDWASRYVPGAVKERVLLACGRKCVQCGSTIHLEIDHILPISRGGTSEEPNLQVLCRSCNRKKRANITYTSAEQVATHDRRPETERETEREEELTSDKSDPFVPEPKPEPRKNPYPEAFQAFWRDYPTDALMSKKKAFEQWKKLAPDDREAARAAIPAFKDHCRKNPTYRAVHAQRFLSERRFDGFTKETIDPAQVEANRDRADRLMRRGKYAPNYSGEPH